MSAPLRIAVVCPAPWPPSDDASWRAAQEAAALARRGHAVTVLVPGTAPEGLSEGRRALAALAAGDPDAVAAEPGTTRVLVVGRAIRTGARRRVAGPFDLAAGLEVALARGGFDVVHLHEPLLPSPALASLRHTRAATVATFHRADPLAGVAFLGPLVHRALARVDVRIAASRTVQRGLQEILPGEYEVVPRGADPEGAPAPAAGLLLVARGRDRAGLRFALRVARGLDPAATGPVALLGPREAAWRTRASVPKALRGTVAVLPDDGPETWRAALDRAAVVVLATAGDVGGPITGEALARGRVVLAARGSSAEEHLRHGENALVLPPFQRETWIAALTDILADPARRARIGAAAAATHERPTWDGVARRLEEIYARAIASPRRREAADRVTADLRLRPAPDADPARMARACREAGLDVVAVASPEGVAAAHRLARSAPDELTVIAGREVATADGVVVGLFLTEDVPDGLPLEETLARIRGQGGVTLVPHPETADIPPAALLREHAGLVDLRELATGASGPAGLDAVRDAQRQGLLVTAGSGGASPQAVGGAGMALRAFDGPDDLLRAIAEAVPVVPRRGRRARARGRARARNT